MTKRKRIVIQSQLSVNDFRKQRNRQVAIFMTDLEVSILRVRCILYDRSWLIHVVHDCVVVNSLDYVVSDSFHRVFFLDSVLVEGHLE